MLQKWPQQIGVGCADIGPLEKKYVLQVLDSERLSYGPFLKKFESEFARAHGCAYGFMVNSGTSALSLSLACLKELGAWNDGDEVLCPSVTFMASANAMFMQNLKPVFVDVDERTYNIDPKKIEEKITSRTRAIMVVHLFGQPAEMDPILEIAKRHDLKVIEDSCETMFAKYKGKSVGTFGDLACFSTYMAHYLVTGVGGIALSNNEEYIKVIKSYANHGRDNSYLSIDDDHGLNDNRLRHVVERRFLFERLGYSYRCTEMEGALGVAQLERKDLMTLPRRKNAAHLIKNLSHLSEYLQLPWWPDHSDHGFMMFPIVIKEGAPFTKIDLVMHLEKLNIETRDMNPLISQPFYTKAYGNIEDQYPVAKWINRNGFYIGSHQKIGEKELTFIVQAFNDFFVSRTPTKGA